jgi:stage II sporulation protein GA (sporulation sigma-E factor processing peptidase)
VIVYVDLIFLLNFCIDGALLFTTARIRHIAYKPWRLLLSASIGASYVIMLALPDLAFLFTFIMKCIFSVFMILTAFGFRGLQNFLRALGTFYAVSFGAAGGIFGIHYMLQTRSDVWNGLLISHLGGETANSPYAWWFVVILIAAVLALLRITYRGAQRKDQLVSVLAQVRIYVDEHCVTCTGLIDTGNQLYEPLTRVPVMVTEFICWGDRLPNEWLERIRSGSVESLLSDLDVIKDDNLTNCMTDWAARLRLIPFRGVQHGTQWLPAIKPDKVVVEKEGREWATTRVLVGLSAGALSSDGSYQAIIHPMLMDIGSQ